MTPEGDYQFNGSSAFLSNSPETVAQAVLTRLRLYRGEWFLDSRLGLDKDKILGYGTAPTRDREIQRRILQTLGVKSLVSYVSTITDRAFNVSARIDTIYGIAEINEAL
jgi:hypothetical protein